MKRYFTIGFIFLSSMVFSQQNGKPNVTEKNNAYSKPAKVPSQQYRSPMPSNRKNPTYYSSGTQRGTNAPSNSNQNQSFVHPQQKPGQKEVIYPTYNSKAEVMQGPPVDIDARLAEIRKYKAGKIRISMEDWINMGSQHRKMILANANRYCFDDYQVYMRLQYLQIQIARLNN